MSGGAIVFMSLAWGVILCAVAITMSALLKAEKK